MLILLNPANFFEVGDITSENRKKGLFCSQLDFLFFNRLKDFTQQHVPSTGEKTLQTILHAKRFNSEIVSSKYLGLALLGNLPTRVELYTL